MKKPPGKPPSQRHGPEPDPEPERPVSFRDLADGTEIRQSIREADLILGVHFRTGEECGMFFGASRLKRIIRRDEGEAIKTLRVPLDPDSAEPDCLAALVMGLKGSTCYYDGDGGLPAVLPGVN
jgi:hypothetical protein